jgi:RNA polymerase sigma-70 factor (ECF subfamily)
VPNGFDEPSDGMLVEAVLSGRREQFAIVVQRYQSALLRMAESRLGCRDWAEDVVQETFLCALKWLNSYDSRFSFRTWLWTIMLNQCRRQYKRRAQRPADLSWDADRARIATHDAEPLTSDNDVPLARLIDKERQLHLQDLLRQLPEVQADALRLRFYGGLKFQEIADAMQCSLSSAKNRVRWGLTKMNQLMAGDAPETLTSSRNDSSSRESDS